MMNILTCCYLQNTLIIPLDRYVQLLICSKIGKLEICKKLEGLTGNLVNAFNVSSLFLSLCAH